MPNLLRFPNTADPKMKCIPVPGAPSLEVLLRGFEMMCPLFTWQMLRAPGYS